MDRYDDELLEVLDALNSRLALVEEMGLESSEQHREVLSSLSSIDDRLRSIEIALQSLANRQ